MRRKIIKKLDSALLDEAIYEFEKVHYDFSSQNKYNYIIMSEETRHDLLIENLPTYPLEDCMQNITISSNESCVYKGYNKIVVDNSIPYGEVEIR